MFALYMVAISICFLTQCSESVDIFNDRDSYTIPLPKIEVFTPRGIRVSIEDSPGIRLFAFHSNINKELSNVDPGKYSKEVRLPQEGQWTFEDTNIQLHIGDKICYWTFVIKDTWGYQSNVRCSLVQELLPSPFVPSPPSNTELPHYIEHQTIRPKPKPTSTTVYSDASKDLLLCEETILNSTQSLISLITEVEKLKKLNKALIAGLDEYPGSRQMRLNGASPDGTAISVVQFVLREKLDLKPKVLWAVREGTDMISFEVSSVSSKFEILSVAKEKLKHSKLEFS